MTPGHYLYQFLQFQGIRQVFFVPGLSIDPLLHILADTPHLNARMTAHEAGSGYMALGFSCVTDLPGVVLATGGPGLSNLATPVLSARQEKQPLLVITGKMQPETTLAFQHLSAEDHQLFFKARFHVKQAEQFPELLAQAYAATVQHPQGPVQLEIPYALQRQKLVSPLTPSSIGVHKLTSVKPASVQSTFPQIKPDPTLVWLGAETGLPRKKLLHWLEKNALRWCTTLAGKGVLPDRHPLSLGVLGFGGDPSLQEYVLSEAVPQILALGVRFSDRNTLNWHPQLMKKTIYSWGQPPEPFLEQRAPLAQFYTDKPPVQLLEQSLLPVSSAPSPAPPDCLYGKFLSLLSEEPVSDWPVFTDAGLCKILAGKYLKIQKPKRFFLSHHVAAMGWGLAAGIGAAATRHNPVLVLTGDGSLYMHGLELAGAVGLPLKIIVHDNGGMQSVLQRRPDHEAFAKMVDVPALDWNALLSKVGYHCMDVCSERDLLAALERLHQPGSVFIRIVDT